MTVRTRLNYWLAMSIFLLSSISSATGQIATNFIPADGSIYMNPEVVLSWTPGMYAATHDVYFGTDFDDVNDADRSDPRGVLASQGQIATTYNIGYLDFGQTYYWRVDEVNAPPGSTIFKGDVWNFTRMFPKTTDTALRIVSWNIEWLGQRNFPSSQNPPRTQEQINAIAQRILTFDAAVLALQEIMLLSVLENICSQLGASWRIYRPSTLNALLYDESKVEMLSVEKLERLDNPPYTPYPGRKPVSAVFRPVGTYADPFRVIGVHCNSTDANIRNSEAIWLRTKTIELLGNPDETNDIVLLGDFNSHPGSTPHLSLEKGNILDLLPKENWRMNSTGFGGEIDHCFVTQGAKHRLSKETTFVIRPEHYGETWGQFRETYSDHFPIFIDLEPEACTGLEAHWKLDETEGKIAADSVGNYDGSVVGDPVWQPSGGMVDGALQFDGIGDYITTPSVLDPAVRPFGVFAWIKGGAPGQVIISQAGGANWLLADPSEGKLMTRLSHPPGSRFAPPPLISEFVIADDDWHSTGFVWDYSYRRSLYVDGIEVARDSERLSGLDSLASADGGLYIGAGHTLDISSFFSGLIDDVRIYHRSLSVDEIEAIIGFWPVEDFETGNFSKFPWIHSGDGDWVITSGEKNSRIYSAQAGLIEDDQTSTLTVMLDCGDGDISFYCKVSSERAFDYLKFYIDKAEQGKWSGDQDWIQVSFPVTSNTRTFKWTYSKDGSASRGDDTAWIDDIVFPVN